MLAAWLELKALTSFDQLLLGPTGTVVTSSCFHLDRLFCKCRNFCLTEEAKVLYQVIQWYQYLEANAATALAASAGLALGIAPLAMGVMPFSWRKVRLQLPSAKDFLMQVAVSQPVSSARWRKCHLRHRIMGHMLVADANV